MDDSMRVSVYEFSSNDSKEKRSSRIRAKVSKNISESTATTIYRGEGKRVIKRKVDHDFEEDLNKVIRESPGSRYTPNGKSSKPSDSRHIMAAQQRSQKQKVKFFVNPNYVAPKPDTVCLGNNGCQIVCSCPVTGHNSAVVEGYQSITSSRDDVARVHPLIEFECGSIVWVKSGQNNEPFWPARVVDPMREVPLAVKYCVERNQICVMFYGPSIAKSRGRDFAWVKEGMVFPFTDYQQEFKQKGQLYKPRRKAFDKAFQEAVSAEAGMDDAQLMRFDATEPFTDIGGCHGCGAELVEAMDKTSKKKRTESSVADDLCPCCTKMYTFNQYCPVCMRVWFPNERENWVACDRCDLWVHAECEKISHDKFEEIGVPNVHYLCPQCRKAGSVTAVASHVRSQALDGKPCPDFPDKIKVRSEGICGLYLSKDHRVVCECSQCVGHNRNMSVSEFEVHSGSRRKKWKDSIFLADSPVKLVAWLLDLLEDGAVGLGWDPSLSGRGKTGGRSSEPDKEAELFEPIKYRWTSGHCAVCDVLEDAEDNKTIMCNECLMYVHEQCYGVRTRDIKGTWICRSCESRDENRECCLCPVQGGALKPTTLSGLWAHIRCGWWIPETGMSDVEKMEPIEGVQSINIDRFKKLGCSICRQPHGACIQCSGPKCLLAYHPMCGQKSGLVFEVQCANGTGGMKSYCPQHRPARETEHTVAFQRQVEASQQRLRQNGGRLRPVPRIVTVGQSPVVEERRQASLTPPVQASVSPASLEEEWGASRCQPYVPRSLRKNVKLTESVPYYVCGTKTHSAEEIGRFRGYREPKFKTLRDRIRHIQETSHLRVTFGKSVIHGWGLFAKRPMAEGEIVIDYRGQLIRSSLANVREKKYMAEGKKCYLFSIGKDTVIDATVQGSIARMINHSCSPNMHTKILDVETQDGMREPCVVFTALKDVSIGEELTCNYRFEKEEGKDRVPCLCEAPNCKGFMN